MGKRLFVDMDGTLAEFKPTSKLEDLYEKGYFLNLQPLPNVIDTIKKIKEENPDIEVFILSAVLTDSKYALQEKNEWLDKYIPEIDDEHRIFPPCGEDKSKYIEGGVTMDDYLLDDYTFNLNSWDPPGHGIKLLNGINFTKKTWAKSRVDFESDKLKDSIVSIIRDDVVIVDMVENIAEKPSLKEVVFRAEKRAQQEFAHAKAVYDGSQESDLRLMRYQYVANALNDIVVSSHLTNEYNSWKKQQKAKRK
ncbi:MAG: hypothetical protein E7242_01165 [Lachnospiraceae bacterium]|nr:hypothetical protein [Lachnospiraceae bacterium]